MMDDDELDARLDADIQRAEVKRARLDADMQRAEVKRADHDRQLCDAAGPEYVREAKAAETAEQFALYDAFDESLIDDEDDFGVDDIEPLIVKAMRGAGWVDRRPVVHLDVADDDWRCGWVDDDGGLHLHPLMLNRWTVLHELAHSLDVSDGHAATFRLRLVQLVSAGIDPRVGKLLAQRYKEFGVPARNAAGSIIEAPWRPSYSGDES